MNINEVEWRKGTRSTAEGDNCVEVAGASRIVAFRDSKDPDGPMLVVSRRDFGRFAQALKSL
ncbi:DUF397 domain-containing protein [Actinomadura formosensis]|uniref:DUF397 domain-containing protein n=1 Tax=Actinomadura formosensis TaxID=60706 RepID=UPI003D948058